MFNGYCQIASAYAKTKLHLITTMVQHPLRMHQGLKSPSFAVRNLSYDQMSYVGEQTSNL